VSNDTPNQDVETLKLSIDKARRGETNFIRNTVFALAVIAIISIAKSAADNGQTVSITLFGISDIPKELILKQVSLIKVYLSCLLIYSVSEWCLAIIDLNRQSQYPTFSGKHSLVVIIADGWDKIVKPTALKAAAILDFMQKFAFLIMFGAMFWAIFEIL